MQVARSLRTSAEALEMVAEEGDPFGNAMAICVIHSAIAYADAVAIAYGGFKSAEGEHVKAVEALEAALGRRADPARVKSLLRIITKKDTVSYQGVYFTVGDARVMVEELKVFSDWAEKLYDQRP